MTIHCKLCKHAVQSSKPGADAQAADVLQRMKEHINAHHGMQQKDAFVCLAIIQGLATTHLVLKNFVEIPESETALLDSHQQIQTLLRQFLDTGIVTPGSKQGILH